MATNFQSQAAAIFADIDAVFLTIAKDLESVLGVLEADLPKVQSALSTVATLTALIPSVGAYVTLAEDAIGIVETFVKTADGVLMSLTEATKIGVASTSTTATNEEKRSAAVSMLADAYPTVPTTTHDLHVAIAYAKRAKIQV